MQILPDWLALGRKNAGGSGPAPAWLRDKALDDPLTAAEVMRRQLPTLLEQQPHQAGRLKLLEYVFEKNRLVLPAIERRVETAALPLQGEALQAALAGDNLLKIMASGYAALLSTVRAQKVPAAASNIGRLATVRIMECLTRRQHLACRAYAPPSANTWQRIHQTYAYAHANEMLSFSFGGRTIEHEYMIALLLAWADPTKFSRQEFAPLHAALVHYSPLARVRPIGDPLAEIDEKTPIFLVREDDTGPGKRISKAPREHPERHGWLVDCRTLVAALEQAISQREQGAQRLGNEPAIPLSILRALRTAFRSPRGRRFARQSFKPRGDLVIGLPGLLLALAGGRITEQPATSEWAIVDESPDGFGLRYLRGESGGLQVGEVVGLRPRERDRRLHVCIVRRVLNGGAGRLELGLQELSPMARATALPHPLGKGLLHGIHFPSLPAWKGKAGLLVPIGTMTPEMRINVDGREFRATQILETVSRYDLWALT